MYILRLSFVHLCAKEGPFFSPREGQNTESPPSVDRAKICAFPGLCEEVVVVCAQREHGRGSWSEREEEKGEKERRREIGRKTLEQKSQN